MAIVTQMSWNYEVGYLPTRQCNLSHQVAHLTCFAW